MDNSDFVWDGFSWKTLIPFTPRADTPASAVPVYYAPEGREDEPLDDTEIASVAWTADNLSLMWHALLPAVFSRYESIRANPEGLDPDQLPAVSTLDELHPLISIESVYVHQVSKDGIPYVGFEFACIWEEEHGLGVLAHGTRVVEVGGADSAVLLWIAEEDSERAPTATPH